tara:strand:- start:96 stop:755 length:660 start_codon:yes stop_codon:yes gene_type:complete
MMTILPTRSYSTDNIPLDGDLRVYIDFIALSALKRFIKENYPGIKPGHIVEAIARGLGYRKSYNDLRYDLDNAVPADIDEEPGIRADVDETAFVNFLQGRGYTDVPKDLFRRALCASTAVVLRLNGKVTMTIEAAYGNNPTGLFNWGQPPRKPSETRAFYAKLNAENIYGMSDPSHKHQQEELMKASKTLFKAFNGTSRTMPHGAALFLYEERQAQIEA